MTSSSRPSTVRPADSGNEVGQELDRQVFPIECEVAVGRQDGQATRLGDRANEQIGGCALHAFAAAGVEIVGHANFSSPPETQDYDATCYAATEMVEQARDVVGRFGRARAVLRGRCVCLSNMLSVERTVLRLKHGT